MAVTITFSISRFKLNLKTKMGFNNTHQHFIHFPVDHLYWLDPGMRHWLIWTFSIISSGLGNTMIFYTSEHMYNVEGTGIHDYNFTDRKINARK